MIALVVFTAIGMGIFAAGCLVGRWMERSVGTGFELSTLRDELAELAALHSPGAVRDDLLLLSGREADE